jgi:hypothetical protein
MVCGTQIKASDTANENVANSQVNKPPKHVYGRRREPLAMRFGEGTLKGAPHHAAGKMWNSVGENGTAQEVRNILNPFHRRALQVFVERLNRADTVARADRKQNYKGYLHNAMIGHTTRRGGQAWTSPGGHLRETHGFVLQVSAAAGPEALETFAAITRRAGPFREQTANLGFSPDRSLRYSSPRR